MGTIRRFVSCTITLIICALVSACGSTPKRDTRIEPAARVSKAPVTTPSTSPRNRGGGYYLDDGPGDAPPADLESVPDAVPRLDALHRGAMRPYVVMGQSFTPMTELTQYRARGVASWYGRRYHGKQTSSGEIYDMYSMTAAHPVLPIPSYVRVTNVANGKSVVVRVNDRGPFIDNRLIDLSYTAAHRIGVLGGGHALVEVESIIPDGAMPVSVVASAASRARINAARAAANNAASTTTVSTASHSEDSTQVDPIVAIAAAPSSAAPVAVSLAESPMISARTAAVESGGVYLQLGAFGSRENAESYLARAKIQVDWIAQLVHVVSRDGMYRVHAGPYANPTEAKLAAERIAVALGTRPIIVTR